MFRFLKRKAPAPPFAPAADSSAADARRAMEITAAIPGEAGRSEMVHRAHNAVARAGSNMLRNCAFWEAGALPKPASGWRNWRARKDSNL